MATGTSGISVNEEEEFEFRARADKERRTRSQPAMSDSAGMEPSDMSSSTEKPIPSMGDVALNAIPKGLANLLNTPVTLNHLLMRGLATLPVVGDIDRVKEVAAMPATNLPMKAMEKVGLVDPEKEPQTGPQRIVDTAIQSAVGALAGPGGTLSTAARAVGVGLTSGAAAQTTKELTGSDLLAAAAGVVMPFAISGTGRQTSSFIGTQTKKDLLKEARKEGLVVEPAAVHSGRPTEMLESFGGKASVAQLSSIKNQPIINDLAAKSIGLPKGTEMTPAVLNAFMKKQGEVYQEISNISPRAAKALEDLKQVRFDASDYWKFYNKQGDPKAGKMARKLDAQADALENVIDQEAKKLVEVWTSTGRMSRSGSQAQSGSSPRFGNRPGDPQVKGEFIGQDSREVGFATPSGGKGDVGFTKTSRGGSGPHDTIDMEKALQAQGDPNILNRLRASRKLIARAHDIERALVEGPGEVSAPALARMKANDRPLQGELDLIARFNQAFGRSSRVASTVPPPSVSGTDAITSMLMGSAGAAAFGPVGATLAVTPLLRKPARELVLSKMVQDHLLKEAPRTPTRDSAIRALMTGKTAYDQNPVPNE